MKKRYLKFVKDHPEAGRKVGDLLEETPETRKLVARGIATRIKATAKHAEQAPKTTTTKTPKA